MPGGSVSSLADLPDPVLVVVNDARRAVLTTVDEHGRPHAVPVCFAIDGDCIVSAVDRKPKSTAKLARLRNVRATSVATVLFDRWDEDWERLAWVMVRGHASVAPPGTAGPQLAARYPQYRSSPPQGEVIVVVPQRITYWSYSPSS